MAGVARRLHPIPSHCLLQRVKDNRNRIDTEVAQLRTSIEQWKLDFFKYFVGMCHAPGLLAMRWKGGIALILALWLHWRPLKPN
jgi:hypothetical protein